jgi:hypothetical protein
MQVWLPRLESGARPLPLPTIASTSKVTASGDKPAAGVNDLWPPQNSNDHSRPYLHWWPKKGTLEWVQFDFARPTALSSAEVYWFDDTGEGEVRAPQSWQLLYKDGETWKPVAASGPYGAARDRFNHVGFRPVRTMALRLEVQSQKDFSSGVLEWSVR